MKCLGYFSNLSCLSETIIIISKFNVKLREITRIVIISSKITISFTDSMGTIGSGVFEYEKPPNTSSTLLIVFALLLVAGIAIFIVSARGKMKTR